jgi:nucleoside-diphosphate-sugar epimerase
MNKLENKIILVTGAGGFIGSHLVAGLSQIAGVKLLLLARQARQSTQQNVVWLKGDLKLLTPEYWQSKGVAHIDYVFHLGAFTPKNAVEANQINRSIEDNIAGTHALLQSLPVETTKLIFSSTLDVYAPINDDEVLTEGSPVKPSTLYGSSKLFCEHLITVWAREKSCDYAILRYGHIYGPGEEQYEKLIPVVIRTLLANQAPVIYGDGSALRDYLYVGDAVEATLRAGLMEGTIGPLNIVRGKSDTLREIVQLMIRLTGSNKEIKFLYNRPNGSSFRFDNDLMKKALGNWPMTDLEKGLANEVDAWGRKKHER